MRNRILLTALLFSLLLLCLGFIYRQTRPQYEYKVEYYGTISEKKLNELGALGWELTAVTTNNSGVAQTSAFYFKRAKQ